MHLEIQRAAAWSKCSGVEIYQSFMQLSFVVSEYHLLCFLNSLSGTPAWAVAEAPPDLRL